MKNKLLYLFDDEITLYGYRLLMETTIFYIGENHMKTAALGNTHIFYNEPIANIVIEYEE